MIVDGSDRTPYSVRVLGREEHPVASFYSSQKLDPTRGYIQTRDGTLLSYRVVLPDSSLHGAGPYDLVITYSGYQPSLETGDAHQNRPFEQFSQLGYVSLLEMVKTHPHDGHFWQSRSAEVANIKVPTLQVVSWQDPQVGSRAANLYEQFSAGTPVRLVGVNGFHQYWS